MTPTAILLAALLAPFIGAVLIGLSGRSPRQRESVTIITAVTLVGLVAALYPTVEAGGRPGLEVLTVLPGLELAFTVEPLGLLFALIASSLWVVNSVYSIGYVRAHHERHQTRFFVCFALSLGSTMGIAFAGNLFTLFIFYEVLTVVTYPLVTHAGTVEAMRAGRIYFGFLLGTSVVLFLSAMLWTRSLAGTLDFRPGGILAGKIDPGLVVALLLLFLFGVGKAALMPFHRWLPAAMVAPTPVSALLHAVAVVKAGVFTILKLVLYTFGPELLQSSGAARGLLWLAALTVLTASLIALGTDNLKRRLAYSTVSQLSYIVAGALLANHAGLLGGGMQILMHAFGKITLFFCAGAIIITAHVEKVSEMRGLGRAMPWTMLAFLLGSLSIIGLPPFGGSWSKWLLFQGAIDAEAIGIIAVLAVSSLLSIGYLLPIVVRAYVPGRGLPAYAGEAKEAPLACLIPPLATGTIGLLLFLFPGPFFRLLSQVVPP